MNKFYMVWHEGDRAPKIKHISKILAQNEAERLANTNEGNFYLLEAISVSRKISTITTKLE